MKDKIYEGIKRHIHPLDGLDQAVLIEARPGYAKISVEIPPRCLNIYGNVHGGFLFTLCDTVSGMATYAYEMVNTTAEADIHFVKNARPSTHKLFVECNTVHKGRTTVLNQIEITGEDGSLIATASFTMFLLKPIE